MPRIRPRITDSNSLDAPEFLLRDAQLTYVLQLTEAGKAFYKDRDRNIERAVIFLVERMGVENWQRRRQVIHDRYMTKLTSPGDATEGVSLRDRDDEIGWYIFLAETLIADPPAVDSDQVHRLWPYVSAFGRKLDAILAIRNVDERLSRLLREVREQDPDQALFELFVGASYVEEGWSVEALPEAATKTPDFEIKRGLVRFEVECKRLARRGEYAELERDAWLRQWEPAGNWLVENKLSFFFTIVIHVELASLAQNYIFDAIRRQYQGGGRGFRPLDSHELSFHCAPTDYKSISRALKATHVKLRSSAERKLITGRHEPDFGLTAAIGGRPVTVGPPTIAGNVYWDSISYASGAYWRTDAPAAVATKARDIVKRLSDATAQLSGRHDGIVHLGIEAGEGDDVELLRTDKIINSVSRFDPRGKPLEWVFIHYFRHESRPDGRWIMDETLQWHGKAPILYRPLRAAFVVSPHDTPFIERFSPSGSTESTGGK